MSDDVIRRLLRSLGRPLPPFEIRSDLAAIDARLTQLEYEQREIEARLRLLEHQARRHGEGAG